MSTCESNIKLLLFLRGNLVHVTYVCVCVCVWEREREREREVQIFFHLLCDQTHTFLFPLTSISPFCLSFFFFTYFPLLFSLNNILFYSSLQFGSITFIPSSSLLVSLHTLNVPLAFSLHITSLRLSQNCSFCPSHESCYQFKYVAVNVSHCLTFCYKNDFTKLALKIKGDLQKRGVLPLFATWSSWTNWNNKNEHATLNPIYFLFISPYSF